MLGIIYYDSVSDQIYEIYTGSKEIAWITLDVFIEDRFIILEYSE